MLAFPVLPLFVVLVFAAGLAVMPYLEQWAGVVSIVLSATALVLCILLAEMASSPPRTADHRAAIAIPVDE
ncbi:conserved hypothetical protein (plasmid) [Methylobacterium nodulans ORS 2060]|uniref:Uncharacterized protein n=1 Tax=Methylobacterium nodulans (strain LMG 21967 / CNCM I-2342 / ORS 2060) TaxID=460265 RepID=B8IY08_METNO|nr:conserved hypothetical protein [Methylobacterium nodulans ORS 2060]